MEKLYDTVKKLFSYWFCLCWSCEKTSEVEEGGLLI